MVLASTHGGAGAMQDSAVADAEALRRRLVAYVQALGARTQHNSGVWVEHSYARAGGAASGGAGSGAVRELLARVPSPPPGGELDVCGYTVPPAPPGGCDALPAAEPEPDEGEWEERLEAAAAAAGAGGARLAATALGALRDLRLARLATAPAPRALRRDQVKRAAIRVRLALAPLWAWSGAGGAAGGSARGAAWLHALVAAHAPRATRALWDELVGELTRGARLAHRLLAPPPPPPPDPLAAVGPEVGPEESAVWVAWVSGGGGAGRRWVRRLRARLHLRTVRAAGPPAAAPDAWCAAAVASARHQLDEILAQAGSRAVVLAGCGAGASLCALLAGGAADGVRGLALLAPPLLTPEGAYCPGDSDDPLAEVRVPVLLVAGGGGAGAGAACSGVSGRRAVWVRGADGALRLPLAHRAALRLPQHALDAAIVEEVVRFAREVAEPLALDVDSRDEEVEQEHTEYAHLPPFTSQHVGRNVEITDPIREESAGCAWRAPLPSPTLLQPAPAPLQAAPAPLQPSDILQMPIVFADDPPAPAPKRSPARTPEPAPAVEEPVTVTSGGARGGAALKYTRVIVAKRGGARPLVLRRALRLLPPTTAAATPGAASAAAAGNAGAARRSAPADVR